MSRARGQAGMTILELAVALVVMGMVTLIVERTLTISSDTDRYLDARERAQLRGARVAHEIHRDVTSSRRIFSYGAEGNAYAAALDLTRTPPDPAVRLPLPEEGLPLGPDAAGEPRTGNALLFIREIDAVLCPADPTTGRVRRIDIYRFVCWYPRQTTTRIVTDETDPALDLCVWRSVGYPSYLQIVAIEDASERIRVVKHLHNERGYAHAWNPSGAVDSSFYAMDMVGTLAGQPSTAFVIREDADLSDGGRLVHAGAQLARTDPTSPAKRVVFTADDPSSWVPNGLEVKVTGPSSHRRVWFRLLVETQAYKGRTATHASTLIAIARNL